jgi:putative transposon-encoded protein
MLVMAEFTFEGREVITKEVTKTGTGAHVFVPKDWLGEEVAIIRLDTD